MKKTIAKNDNTVSQPSEPENSTNISFPVVGIGASADRLEALGQFYWNVPKNSGIAFMVIQHLDPNHVGIIDQHEKSIGVFNVETNELFWSDEIYRIFDCEPQEFDASYEAFLEFIHPDDKEKVNSAYLISLETKAEYQIEYRIITKNNQLKYVKEICTTTFNEKGKPLSSFGIVIDITESKQAEIILQKSIEEITVLNEELNQTNQELIVAKVKAEESEEKFRAMYNNAPLSYQSLDENGSFIDINPMWLKTLGYERVEVIGKWFGDFLHPDYVEHFRINFPAFKNRGYVSDVQFKLRRKDNSYIYVSFEGCVGYTAEGKFKQTYCVFKDITEQKALENALIKAREKAEESEQRFKSLIENAPDGVVIIDGNGKFKYVSPNAERLFGYNENEGVSLSGDESTHPDDLPLILTTLQTILADPKQKPTVEYRFKMKNGEFRWIETTFTNLLSDKTINGIILNFTDVTERMQIIEELIIAKEKAERNEIELIKAQKIAHLGSWYLNVETNEVVWTEELYKMYGFDPTLPPPYYTEHMKLFTPESWEILSTSLAKTQETGIPYELELRTIRKDNSNGWMWVRGEAVLDESNKIIGLWGAAQDITVRKLSELDLEISQKKATKLNTLLNAILESPQDMIVFALDNKYCYSAFTKAHKQVMKNLWGVDIKVGDNMLDYISRLEDRNKARNSFGRCLRGEYFIMKEEYGDSSLQRKYYETRYSPLFNELKEIIGLTVFNIDITERKLAEEKLRKSEERYALVIEASEQGIWDWNVETNEIFYSEQWKKQIGYKDDELKNEFNTWVEHLHPNEKEYCQNALLSYLNKPVEHFILDFRFRHKDGTYRWIHNKAASIRNNEGKVIRLFGTHTDITESKLSEAIFKDIIEKNPMSIQILDLEGYPIQVNSAHTKLFGAEILPDYTIFKDPQLLSLGFGELFERVKKGEVVVFPDTYYNVHDVDPSFPDSPVWVKALGFTLNDNNGKPNRLVFMHENITDRRFAEQELIKSKEHAEESDRLKSAFLANMSHEIRTPMNGILGFSELLKEPGLTGEQQQEYIKIIEKSGKRMLNIINDIIDISKIEARLMNLNISESNVNGQIEYIYTFFKPEVEAKGLKLSYRNSLTTKEAFIKTDREKLYAILTNLVKNAIKYTNEGEIEIGYKMVEMQSVASPQCNAFLQFYVKDTGIGIPKNRQEAIFERFIQADIADKMALQGAGLGLAITKSYIEMLGGEIWVESEEGIGSAFYFTLPYNAELVNETSDRHTEPCQPTNTPV